MTLQICKCSGREIWRMKGYPNTLIQYKPEDEDGFPTCIFCGGYQNLYCPAFSKGGTNGPWILAQCDTCPNWFKGYKRWPKISYTCPECESKL